MHVLFVMVTMLFGGLLPAIAQTVELPSLVLLKEYTETSQNTLMRDEAMETDQRSGVLVPLPERERGGALSSAEFEEGGKLTVEINGVQIVLRDVPRSSWFAPYVRAAVDAQLLSGYSDAAGNPTGEFGPANPVTVAELSKLAVSVSDINQNACPAEAKNEKAKGQWFSPFLACAEERQWVLYGDATVDPFRPALRGEVIVTMLQALAVKPPSLGQTGSFTDVTPSTQYASAIAKAKADGIVQGYTGADGSPTGLFGPADTVTRAEMVKILMLAVQKYAD